MRFIRTRTGTFFIGVFLAFGVFTGQAQDTSKLDSLYSELENYFEDNDLPPGLIEMADSLMDLYDIRMHSVSVRAGYLSDVLTAGRDLGIDQHGFNAGLSYYHPSGLFADIATYSNSEYSPAVYLTNLSLGIWKNFGEHWAGSVSHEFMMYYKDPDSYPFNKSARASAFYQRKGWEIGLDYRYLYGKESAHRLVGLANGRITFSEVGWIDRISILPGASVQWGNSEVVYLRQSETPLQDLNYVMKEGNYPEINDEEFRRLSFLLYQERYLLATQYLQSLGYSRGDIEKLFLDYQSERISVEDSYGLMNLALYAGISLSKRNWNLFINYTYNFPFALPGETYEYPQNDYISASLMYTFIWE